jgi:hypothetical protein
VNALGRPETHGLTFEIVGDAAAPRIDWASLYQGLKRDVG